MFPKYVPSTCATRRHESEKFGFGSCTGRRGSSVRPPIDSTPALLYSTFSAPAEKVVGASTVPRNYHAPANEHNYSAVVTSKNPSQSMPWRSAFSSKSTAAGSGNKSRFAAPVPAIDGLAYCPESAPHVARPSTAASHSVCSYPVTRPCSSTLMRDVWRLPFAPTGPQVTQTSTSVFKLSDRAASRDSFNWYTTVVTKTEIMLVARDAEEAKSSASRPISYESSSQIKKSFNKRIQSLPPV